MAALNMEKSRSCNSLLEALTKYLKRKLQGGKREDACLIKKTLITFVSSSDSHINTENLLNEQPYSNHDADLWRTLRKIMPMLFIAIHKNLKYTADFESGN